MSWLHFEAETPFAMEILRNIERGLIAQKNKPAFSLANNLCTGNFNRTKSTMLLVCKIVVFEDSEYSKVPGAISVV